MLAYILPSMTVAVPASNRGLKLVCGSQHSVRPDIRGAGRGWLNLKTTPPNSALAVVQKEKAQVSHHKLKDRVRYRRIIIKLRLVNLSNFLKRAVKKNFFC